MEDLFALGLRIQSIGFDDATRQLKGLDETGKGTASRLGILGELQKEAAEHAGAHHLSLSRLERAFESFAAEATGTNHTLGLLATTMSHFAIGTVMTAGIVGGIAAVVAIYEHMTAGAREATKSVDESITALKKLGDLKGDFLLAKQIKDANTRLDEHHLNIKRLYNDINGLLLIAKASDGGGAGVIARFFIGLKKEDIAALQSQINSVLAGSLAASQTIADNEAKGVQDRDAARSHDLASLVKSNHATAAERAEALRRYKEYAHEMVITAGSANSRLRATIGASMDELGGALFPKDNSGQKAEEALARRIETLKKGLVFDNIRASVTAQLREIEAQLTRTVNDGTASIEARARAAGHLTDVMEALGRKLSGAGRTTANTNANDLLGFARSGHEDDMRTGMSGFGAGIKMPDIHTDLIAAVDKQMKALVERARQLQSEIGNVFGRAITSGFTAAFSGKGIGGAFKALGKTILSGLGEIFIQLGEKMVAASAIMQAFQAAITSFLPGAGLVAGVALIALGAAMSAIGGKGGGGGGSGGGSSSGYGSYGSSRTDDITKIRLMPGYGTDQGSKVTAGGMYVFAPTIIGQNDPVAQRQLAEMAAKGARRGL